MAVNVLYIADKSIDTLRRSDQKILRDKQANLLLITDAKNAHYTSIKNIPSLLSRENRAKRHEQHFCLN